MTRKAIIQALECCSTEPRKCGDCPLCDNLNCMYVSRQEAMQALKSSPEPTEEVKEKLREMTDRILDEIEAALESNYAARKESIEGGEGDNFLRLIDGKIAALRGMQGFVEELLDLMLAQLGQEVEP